MCVVDTMSKNCEKCGKFLSKNQIWNCEEFYHDCYPEASDEECREKAKYLCGQCSGRYASRREMPNPGSDEARELGCTCPVLDNAYGKGDAVFGYTDDDGNPCFWINEKCPLHAPRSFSDKEH